MKLVQTTARLQRSFLQAQTILLGKLWKFFLISTGATLKFLEISIKDGQFERNN